jgi:hypothetical protein
MGNSQMDTWLLPRSPNIFDPTMSLSASDICWIMDEMASLEVDFIHAILLVH